MKPVYIFLLTGLFTLITIVAGKFGLIDTNGIGYFGLLMVTMVLFIIGGGMSVSDIQYNFKHRKLNGIIKQGKELADLPKDGE